MSNKLPSNVTSCTEFLLPNLTNARLYSACSRYTYQISTTFPLIWIYYNSTNCKINFQQQDFSSNSSSSNTRHKIPPLPSKSNLSNYKFSIIPPIRSYHTHTHVRARVYTPGVYVSANPLPSFLWIFTALCSQYRHHVMSRSSAERLIFVHRPLTTAPSSPRPQNIQRPGRIRVSFRCSPLASPERAAHTPHATRGGVHRKIYVIGYRFPIGFRLNFRTKSNESLSVGSIVIRTSLVNLRLAISRKFFHD